MLSSYMEHNRNQNLTRLFFKFFLAICVWCHCLTTAQGLPTLTSKYVGVACPQEEQLLSAVFTCSFTGSLLRWTVRGPSGSGLSNDTTFSGSQQARIFTLQGVAAVFIASVTSAPPNFVSTLLIIATMTRTSLEGVRVECTDVNAGLTSETTISIASPPSIPRNIRISSTQNGSASSTVTLQWDPPSVNGGDDVDNYTLTVTPEGISRTGSTVTMATVEVSYNTAYTVRVSATNCAGRSPEAVLGPFTLTRINCMPPSAANGVIIEQLTSTTEGSRIRFYCDETFVPNNVREAVCGSNATWSPDPGQHVCTLVDCGTPQLPANSVQTNSTGTLKGQKVTFQCTTDLITSVCTSVSDCSSEGLWSPDPQQVVCGARCSPPSVPSNGFLGEVNETTAVFGCNEGYSPQGTITAVCVATNTWSPEVVCSLITTDAATSFTSSTRPVVYVDCGSPEPTVNALNGMVTQGTTITVTSAVACSVVFYIFGVISTIFIYLTITRCRKKSNLGKSFTNERREPQASGTVYENIMAVQDTEKAGIELQENIAYRPVKK